MVLLFLVMLVGAYWFVMVEPGKPSSDRKWLLDQTSPAKAIASYPSKSLRHQYRRSGSSGGVWGLRGAPRHQGARGNLTPPDPSINPSAWKGNSRKFALRGLSEVGISSAPGGAALSDSSASADTKMTLVIQCTLHDKGKPVVRRGRKATDLY